VEGTNQLQQGAIFAGDFKIERALSEGGMGAVYVVEQISTGKHRALKVMLPQLLRDAQARERFAQEARVGARIHSDHVVEVIGAGIDDATAMPWLAMELLDGRDLAGVIEREGPMPPARVALVLEQLCDALTRAHAAGVVHRDLKPENVFLAKPRRRGIPFDVKVLDFGISKIIDEHKTSSTATAAIGSPLWMAPEQTMTGAKLRAGTDVWALGLIAFHLLTGRYFWLAANAESLNVMAILLEVVSASPVAASQRAAELGCGHLIPTGFDPWFARCVSRDIGARYPDAGAAYAALAQFLSTAHYPIGTAPETASLPVSQPPLPAPLPTQAWQASAIVAPAQLGPSLNPPPGRPSQRLPIVAAGVTVALGALAFALAFARRSGSTPSVGGSQVATPPDRSTPVNTGATTPVVPPPLPQPPAPVVARTPDAPLYGFVQGAQVRSDTTITIGSELPVRVADDGVCALCPVQRSRGSAPGEPGAISLNVNHGGADHMTSWAISLPMDLTMGSHRVSMLPRAGEVRCAFGLNMVGGYPFGEYRCRGGTIDVQRFAPGPRGAIEFTLDLRLENSAHREARVQSRVSVTL
jgi:serine/threonine protein kinase